MPLVPNDPDTGLTKNRADFSNEEKLAFVREAIFEQKENKHGNVVPVDLASLDTAKRMAIEVDDARLIAEVDAAIAAATLKAKAK